MRKKITYTLAILAILAGAAMPAALEAAKGNPCGTQTCPDCIIAPSGTAKFVSCDSGDICRYEYASCTVSN